MGAQHLGGVTGTAPRRGMALWWAHLVHPHATILTGWGAGRPSWVAMVMGCVASRCQQSLQKWEEQVWLSAGHPIPSPGAPSSCARRAPQHCQAQRGPQSHLCQEPGPLPAAAIAMAAQLGKQGPGWVSPLCSLETCVPHCGSVAAHPLWACVPVCEAVLRSGDSAAVLVYPPPGASVCPRNEAHTRGTRTHTRT